MIGVNFVVFSTKFIYLFMILVQFLMRRLILFVSSFSSSKFFVKFYFLLNSAIYFLLSLVNFTWLEFSCARLRINSVLLYVIHFVYFIMLYLENFILTTFLCVLQDPSSEWCNYTSFHHHFLWKALSYFPPEEVHEYDHRKLESSNHITQLKTCREHIC